MKPFVPQSVRRQMLQDKVNPVATPLGGQFSSMHYRLFSNNVAITDDTVAADLTEATFTGYSPHQMANNAAALGMPYNLPGGGVRADWPEAVKELTDAATPQTIYGAFATDQGTGHPLRIVWKFDQPVILARVGDAVVFTPYMVEGQPTE